LRTEEEPELGHSIGEAMFGLSKGKAGCFAFVRSRKEGDGVDHNVVAQFKELM
jgi:hypothetical protein